MNGKDNKSGWLWVPSLYFAEGLPYVIVITVSVVMYKNLGVSNSELALYTSWFYLPWVIKPIWSPFVDLLKTKRWWILSMQFVLGVGLATLAFAIHGSFFFQASIAVFWLLALSSATHDVAADGFYMLVQDNDEQSFFVGVRNIFYRLAMVVGQGLIVVLVGVLNRSYGMQMSWSIVLSLSGGLMLLLSLYHKCVLPKENVELESSRLDKVGDVFSSFFRKKDVVTALLFILFYRFGEAQLSKISSPFLLDDVSVGGLGMNNEAVGFVYGTIGIVALLVGGLLGGVVVARDGLKKWFWPMIFAMNVPNLVYVFLAVVQPIDYVVVCSSVALEQLGYGFGFTAFTLYLMQFSQGEYKTAHYALCTGFMALGMMLPGMISGYVQELLEYERFFVYVVLCCIPGMIVAKWVYSSITSD